VLSYLLRRLSHLIPLLFGITLVSFFVIQLAPGDYLDNLRLNPEISSATLQKFQQQYGLDRSLPEQYIRWLWGVIHLDFGYSFAWHVPVQDVIFLRLYNTMLLSVSAMGLGWVLALPLGIYSALRAGRFDERLVAIISYIGLSLPSFFLAFLFIYLAARTGWFPTGGMVSSYHEQLGLFDRMRDIISHLMIPAGVLAVGSAAALMRFLRSNILEAMHQPFVTALRARGLSEKKVIGRHVLRLAINPLITIFGYQLASIFSGAALVEIVTGWPGLGSLMLEAIFGQDLYLVMATLLLSAVLLIMGNLVADILLALADPRVRLADKKIG